MWIIIFATIFGILFSPILSQGFYEVIAPRIIRPNSQYHVAVSTHSTPLSTRVDLSLSGITKSGNNFEVQEIVIVQPYSTTTATFEIHNIEPGDYKLIVYGSGGVSFTSSANLKYMGKSYSVFIQTDKAVYKPGHKILFRAIILNPELKPAVDTKSEPLTISISDTAENKVKQWNNVFATKSVFTGELQLSNDVVLGNWNISITIRGQTFNKTIEVVHYVLPKFLVNIQTPKHVTFKENSLLVHIQALYNYGKKVKGNATITVYPTIFSGVIQPIFQNPVRKVIGDFDGSATIDFDIANELMLNDEYERTVIVDVVIEEHLTGRKQNNSAEVHLHKYDYKIDIIKTADYYKPGLKYTAFIKITKNDGHSVRLDNRTAMVRYGYSRTNEVYSEEHLEFDENGVIKLQLYPPINSTNSTALRIEAEYMDLKERMSPVPAAISATNVYLQTSLENESKPFVNNVIDIVVNCTEPMDFINYQIIGRGDVLLAHSFQIKNQKIFRFHFTATSLMVPVTHLLVNYIRKDGHIVADSLDIEIDGILQNSIDIETNTAESRPDSEIDFTIKSQSNAYVGLMAIDQNVGNLRSGYDLSEFSVIEEIKRYDVANLSPYSNLMENTGTNFFWKPGSSNTFDTFTDSGTIFLTNAIASRYRPTLEDIYLRPTSYGSSTVKPDRGVGLAFHSITRPPLAGPYAFSRIPKLISNTPKVYLTEHIEDTWLFTNFSLNKDGKTSLGRKTPHSLNTWVISGFSLDPLRGLGLLKNSPRKLKVSKAFVLSMDLSRSVKREETLVVPIVLYNNEDRDIIADVTIHNPEQKFKFVDIQADSNTTKKIELYRKKKVPIKKHSGVPISFMITPTKLGLIELKVTANSASITQDVLIKKLLVEAEGETQYFTKSIFIDLRRSHSYVGNITFDLPKNIVPHSEHIEVAAIGDFLWPSIMNLDNLIRLPTGCGEQNLVHFMPRLIILKYLKNTRQLSSGILKNALTGLETAYQQQLTYKHSDGSFSAFGNKDKESSVWITAYVALAFKQAEPFIYVDNNVIANALKWLDYHQASNGSFNEVGSIIHHKMQNRTKSLALTAFTLMAFFENRNGSILFNNIINKGIDYIAKNLKEGDDIYTIAICTHVLHLANHPSKHTAFNLLDLKAQTSNNMKWWAESVSKKDENNPWNDRPKSIDIETTSYALLAFLEANLINDALPVVNWLLQQQNSLGGFISSQDTVVGIIAVYKLLGKLSSTSNIDITFKYANGEDRFSITKENSMIDQRIKISNDARIVNVTASGQGIALFRVIYRYNVNVTGPWPMFILDPQVDKVSTQHHLQVSICTSFVSQNLTSVSESNMVVMEVNFPSGFTADIDSLPSLEVSRNVQRVETKNEDTTVILYFNNLTRVEYCPTVSAFRTHRVAKQKSVAVIVYDYYDSSRRARIFYNIKRTTLCDICEDEECGHFCTSYERQQVGEQRSSSSLKMESNGLTLFILTFFYFKLFNY